MTDEARPVTNHLDSHHRDTVERLFAHPLSHNIEWHDVLSLLRAVTEVDERKSGVYAVKSGSEELTFRAEGHSVDADDVVKIRNLLRDAGITPPGDA